jgi:hypothetical protein
MNGGVRMNRVLMSMVILAAFVGMVFVNGAFAQSLSDVQDKAKAAGESTKEKMGKSGDQKTAPSATPAPATGTPAKAEKAGPAPAPDKKAETKAEKKAEADKKKAEKKADKPKKGSKAPIVVENPGEVPSKAPAGK